MPNNTLAISGSIVDAAGLDNIQPTLVTGAAQPFSGQVTVTVTTGFNPVTVPTSARFVVWYPANVTSSPFTLKGVTGDTGIPVSPSQPGFLSLDGNNMPASFGFTSTTTAGTILVKFG